jgi:hypothetical protein
LEPSNERKVLGSLKRVAGELTVESRVDTSSCDVPSQASSHGNTTVLEFRFTVMSHDSIGLSSRETHRIKETHWWRNSDNSLVLPCGKGGSRLGLGGRYESGAVKRNERKLVTVSYWVVMDWAEVRYSTAMQV